jgi:hypothetical protein
VGIDVKVESPYGPDGEVLGDPRAFLSRFLAVVGSNDTKCLQFIDPYGATVFNQLQIPVLIEEFNLALRRISTSELKSHSEQLLRRAREANWADTIIKEYERAATASEAELKVEFTNLRAHIDKVIGVLDDAIRAGPHHYVRFMGD